MDGDNIFFWDGYEIHFYNLKKSFKVSNRQIIALKIDRENKGIYIKTVEPGD